MIYQLVERNRDVHGQCIALARRVEIMFEILLLAINEFGIFIHLDFHAW
jgi:hypothetical protein